jgi:hypothetical protein
MALMVTDGTGSSSGSSQKISIDLALSWTYRFTGLSVMLRLTMFVTWDLTSRSRYRLGFSTDSSSNSAWASSSAILSPKPRHLQIFQGISEDSIGEVEEEVRESY